jgi:ubiquinone/menaquinone biosynthesis C-methylase UbiE
MPERRSRALKNAWRDRVRSWDDQVASSQAFSKVRDALLDLAKPQTDDEAVDLGAGTGFVTIPLAERVKSVIAIDLVVDMLEVARQEAERRGLNNVTTVTEDLSRVELPPASVDLVVSSYALHHLTDEDKIGLVERARSWLRPGGRIVIADMMFGRGARAQDRRIILDKVRRLARKGPGGLWRIVKNAVRFGLRRGSDLPVPPDFWTKALSDAGFVDVTYTSVVSEAGIVSGRVPDR